MAVKTKRNKWGDCEYSHDSIIDVIYSNPDFDISDVFIEDTDKYNNAIESIGLPFKKIESAPKRKGGIVDFDKKNCSDWHMPEQYKTLDMEKYLLDKCNNEEEKQRVLDEYKLFAEKSFVDVLRFLVYFVDTLRENNVVWGVGRGSSVSSFCLFLIGVHKINPLMYQLDYREFLR